MNAAGAGPMNAAFLGLGVMGYPMAGHLAAGGHSVTVYNRSPAKAEAWIGDHPGSAAASPADAANGNDFVFVCVGNDDDVRSVVLGADGCLSAMAPGTVLVDHTTASPTLARELHSAAAAVGVGFIDAPISGGSAGAENGSLTVMCGGDRADFDRASRVIGAYSKACNLIGGPGSGQLCKCMNQIAIAGMVQTLSEAVNFGQRAGLDLDAVFDTISKGAAGSWQMSNRAKTMADEHFNYGFAIEWMRKDLAICIDEATKIGADLTVTELVDGYYAELIDAGHARWDTSSLVHRLQHPDFAEEAE